jgi:hypothetical protein
MGTLNNQNTLPSTVEFATVFVSTTAGAVYYVGSTAQLALLGDTGSSLTGRTYANVNAALLQCVSGRGDTIYLLPGYTESITADAWSNLAATDVSVIGMGRGNNRPALTWTLTGSTMLFDFANFRLLNCQLFLAGPHVAGAALTVTAPITVSAAGCEISDCRIFWGFDVDQIVTIGITTTAAADDFEFHRNYCYAETAAVPTTTFLRLVGADFFKMYDTKIVGPGSTVNIGPVQFLTTPSLGCDLRRCIISSTLASSVNSVIGLAGTTGTALLCGFGILNDSGLVGFVTPASFQFFGCYTSNLAGESGNLNTPVST